MNLFPLIYGLVSIFKFNYNIDSKLLKTNVRLPSALNDRPIILINLLSVFHDFANLKILSYINNSR